MPTGQHRSLKLISVTFKEASLDSPSFRAHVNFFQLLIESTETWVDSLSKSINNWPQQYHDFYNVSNTMLQQFYPAFIQNQLFLDQNHAIPAYESLIQSMSKRWHDSLANLRFQDDAILLILSEVPELLKGYHNTRHNFDFYQLKYDGLLKKYSALSKTHDPSLIMQDSFQLFEVRKSYIDASLELVLEISKVQNILDQLLVNITDTLGDASVNQLIYWNKTMEETMNRLMPDVARAKSQILDHYVSSIEPSESVIDYNVASINASILRGSSVYEKNGWLFMKTQVSSGRVVWVRKWCYVKNGVFGMMSLSPSKTAVQETDKFGIKCIRFSPSEDRRLCMELVTQDSTIVLQCETLKELKSWCNIVCSANDSRFPPEFEEFASTATTTQDKLLTSHSQFTPPGGVVRINPPIVTQYSNYTIMSHLVVNQGSAPNAVTANFWGSVHWGHFALKSYQHFVVQPSEYPEWYPESLKTYDLQMKCVFETVIEPDEFLLLQYSCFWIPNPNQQLGGRCFVTMSNMYFYMNTMGFVSLVKLPLKELASWELASVDEIAGNTIRIYDITGTHTSVKIFLADTTLAIRNVNRILRNGVQDNPKSLQEMIKFLDEPLAAESAPAPVTTPLLLSPAHPIPSIVLSNSKDSEKFVTNYESQYPAMNVFQYNIPAKGLFHILFGDNSPIFREGMLLADSHEFKPSKWYTNGNMLTRSLQYKLLLSKSFLSYDDDTDKTINTVQKLEASEENRYYRVDEVRSGIWLPFISDYEMHCKYVIVERDNATCRLLVYYDLRYKNMRPLNHLAKRVFLTTIHREARAINRLIQDSLLKVGSHGKVVKAVQIFGPLTKSDLPAPPVSLEPIRYKKTVFFRYILKIFVFRTLSISFILTRFILITSRKIILSMRVNRMLTFIFFSSVLFNFFLSARVSLSYWQAKRAEHVVDDLSNNRMERSLYIKDIDLLTSDSPVMKRFESSKYKETRHDIAVRRNELLVEIKILEKIERELLAGEWREFLLQEQYLCNLVNSEELQEYCDEVTSLL